MATSNNYQCGIIVFTCSKNQVIPCLLFIVVFFRHPMSIPNTKTFGSAI